MVPQVLPANQPTEPTYDEKDPVFLALIAALTPLSPLTARGELITVKGIEFVEEGNWSTATGWFDASKSWSGDGLLCWAATSSNLIAWWQSQNPDYQKEGDPWGVDAVWDIYKNTFINDGGIISKGVEWWFDGTGTGSTSAELQYKTGAVSSGGYYRDHLYGGVVEKNVTPANITTLRSASYNQATTLASTLVDYMRNGYAVGLNFISGKQGHAETLWGIEYDTDTQLIERQRQVRKYDIAKGQHPGGWQLPGIAELSRSLGGSRGQAVILH